MSEPTYWVLCYSSADCLSGVRTYLPGTVLQWCRLFQRCRNLPSRPCVTVVQTVLAMSVPTYRQYGHCVTVVKTVLAMSVPTYRALCYSGAGCLTGIRTYLPGTVLQGCRLFKRCPNLPAGHCVTVVQTVKAMSEPTYWALCYSGKDCLSIVKTYLPGTVLLWCRLFKQCQNLPTGHCVKVVQTV